MIDMVRDYTAISLGTAQAASARVAAAGRDAIGVVTGLRSVDLSPPQPPVFDPRTQLAVGREVARGVLSGDLDAVISRIGLAKKSELNAVLAQLQRLERRLGDGRTDR